MSYHISYRNYEASDFDIWSMSLEDVESTNDLLDQALNAIPIDDEEKNLLDRYIHTLRTFAEHQTTFNRAKTLAGEMLQQGRHSDASNAESLARKAAVAVSHCSQTLFVLEVSEDLKCILERDPEEARIMRDEIALIEKEREELARQYDEFMKQRQASKQQAIKAREEEQRRETQRQKTSSIKEWLVNTFGGVGAILFFVIRLIISVLPFVMIGGNFFVSFVLIGVNYIIPFASPVFWIWGLVCAITGVQDFWAVLYYIVFVVAWLPFYVNLIITLVSKRD